MDESPRVEAPFEVHAGASRLRERTRVLKREETFGVFDGHGDILPEGGAEQGLYDRDTRFLSRLEILMGDRRPLLLGSTPRGHGSVLAAHLANPELPGLPPDTVYVSRTIVLRPGALQQRLRFRNFGPSPAALPFDIRFDADHADVFEVRGASRPRRGRTLPPEAGPDGVALAYEGLDGVRRTTRIRFDPAPEILEPRRARFRVVVPAGGERVFDLAVDCRSGPSSSFDEALSGTEEEDRARRSGEPALESTHAPFDAWVARSRSDLHMLVATTPSGEYPHAGLPWFGTVFGRDGLVTALEVLWFRPELARGVLGFLAATQADRCVPERDAEPGKIVHEMRSGEMAALGEVPFGRYYGSVDATPLYLALAGAYARRTGDVAFIRELWPSLERALAWIERDGDLDGDGFVEYARRSPEGLANQGWKDSRDAVFHEDGSLAEGPIALCEVQAYVYLARREFARLADLLGRPAIAEAQRARAEELRRAFEEAFWSEELSTYVAALDGRKRPCRVRTSNAGHALFGGIAAPERALRVAKTLLAPESFSGWGIRTVASSEARYNPMSYHNGSVWPHDGALIAAGFARYDVPKADVASLLTALLHAASRSELQGLPELFCGFPRRPNEGPVRYPVACSPQAWSAGAVFLLVQSVLGLTIDAARSEVRFVRPWLPEELGRLGLRGLRVGGAELDLDLHRYRGNVGIEVVRRRGHVRVLVEK